MCDHIKGFRLFRFYPPLHEGVQVAPLISIASSVSSSVYPHTCPPSHPPILAIHLSALTTLFFHADAFGYEAEALSLAAFSKLQSHFGSIGRMFLGLGCLSFAVSLRRMPRSALVL